MKKGLNSIVHLQGEVLKYGAAGILGIRRIFADGEKITYCIGVSKNIVNDIYNFNLGCSKEHVNIYYLQNLERIFLKHTKSIKLVFKNPPKQLEFYCDAKSKEYYSLWNYFHLVALKYKIIPQYTL